MNDSELILTVLKFLKEQQDEGKKQVDLRNSEIPTEDHERIRDKLVLNKFASFPDTGSHWELAITWHTNGGIDVLAKSQKKQVLTPDGNITFKHKSLTELRKHATTIIVSLIGGLLLAWISSYLFKTEPPIDSKNNIWNIDKITTEQGDSSIMEYNSDSTFLDTTNIQ